MIDVYPSLFAEILLQLVSKLSRDPIVWIQLPSIETIQTITRAE